jgi:Ca2+-binding EF-hand superfamily protein
MKIIVALLVCNISFVFFSIQLNIIDINEFMRGFILTTKGDLKSKIDYTFRIYDENNDNQISGEEIEKMANVIRQNKTLYKIKSSFLFRQSCEC